MSKEEPAWKAELNATIYRYFDQIGGGSIEFLTERFGVALAPHIHAAEQRGFQAGVNKTGDSVGRLREELKLASRVRAEVLREAAGRLDDLEYVGPGDELRRIADEAESS